MTAASTGDRLNRFRSSSNERPSSQQSYDPRRCACVAVARTFAILAAVNLCGGTVLTTVAYAASELTAEFDESAGFTFYGDVAFPLRRKERKLIARDFGFCRKSFSRSCTCCPSASRSGAAAVSLARWKWLSRRPSWSSPRNFQDRWPGS